MVSRARLTPRLLARDTLKPSHSRKVGEHEPDQDGQDALTGNAGKGEDDADEERG